MSYRPQIKKSDGTMQDLPLDAETIKGQEVKGLAFKDTIKNDDIANDAAIAQSKVSGLNTSLNAKIDKSGGELKDTVVTFDDVSGMAANIASGETAKTLFGKIKNWFGRLKTLAFKDTIKNADIAGNADIAQHKIDGLRTDYVASLSVSGKTVTYKNKNGGKIGTFTTQDTTYSNATTVYDGLMSSEDKTKLNGIDSNANNYTLPQATRAALGGVKIGYTKNGDNYPVQLSSSGQMFVTVSGGGGGGGSGGGNIGSYWAMISNESIPTYYGDAYISFSFTTNNGYDENLIHSAELKDILLASSVNIYRTQTDYANEYPEMDLGELYSHIYNGDGLADRKQIIRGKATLADGGNTSYDCLLFVCEDAGGGNEKLELGIIAGDGHVHIINDIRLDGTMSFFVAVFYLGGSY